MPTDCVNTSLHHLVANVNNSLDTRFTILENQTANLRLLSENVEVLVNATKSELKDDFNAYANKVSAALNKRGF